MIKAEHIKAIAARVTEDYRNTEPKVMPVDQNLTNKILSEALQRIVASSKLSILRNYLQSLGIKFVKVFQDAPDMVAGYISPLTRQKALSICKEICKSNPGAELVTDLDPSNWRNTPKVGVKFANGDTIEVHLDSTSQTRLVALFKYSPRPTIRQPVLTLPKLKVPKLKVPKLNQLWDTSLEKKERPLLNSWPDYVWHVTSSANAKLLLTNGKGIGSELFFGMSPDVALIYNRFGAGAIMLRVSSSVLKAKHIAFDVNTSGASFAYYGSIDSKNFEGFTL